MSRRKSTVIACVTVFVLIPALIAVWLAVFGSKNYALLIVLTAVLVCVPFFAAFEGSRIDSRRLMLVAVMTALSVIGRLLFLEIPFVKPVAAMTVFAGMYLGAQSGFVVGALSAVISNVYFGQGPYTAFQMLAWGLIGFVAGLLAKRLNRSLVLLAVYGALTGVAYSLILDVWSAIWISGSMSFDYFIASVVSSAPFTATYAISNVVFLLLLKRPVGAALARMGIKYGL